jgi:large subunit ribosomal protein L21
MYAIIENGSKQYTAKVGNVIKFEKLNAEVGANVEFNVLLVSSEEGVKLGGIEEGAQVNFINSVNTDNFKVENKKLDLVAVPAKLLTDLGEEFVVDSTNNKLKLVQVEAKKLTGLEDWIEENRDVVAGLYPTTAATLLNNLDTAINDENTGLIAKLTAVDSRLITVETSVSNHADRLSALEYAMTWRDMEEII